MLSWLACELDQDIMTAPKKTLVFHIGDHKTGSTAIQSAFAQAQVSLGDRSVFYPAKLAHNYLKQHCNAYAAPHATGGRKKAIAVFRKLAARVRESDADFSLISAEEMEWVDPEVLHDIITRYFADTVDEIHVIAYVRPHAARLLSSFAERTKLGIPHILSGTLDTLFEETLERRRFHYEPRFSTWRRLFGDQFTLRPMIREHLDQGDVVKDFIRHAFATHDFQITGVGAANASLDLEDLMRLKVLQRHLLEHRNQPRFRHMLGWEFSRILATLPAPQTQTKLRLHRSLAERLHTTYLADAQAMDQSFFDRAPLLENALTGALEAAVDTPQSVEPADYLPPSDLRSLAVLSKVICGMLENDGQDWPDFLHAKRTKETQKIARANKS